MTTKNVTFSYTKILCYLWSHLHWIVVLNLYFELYRIEFIVDIAAHTISYLKTKKYIKTDAHRILNQILSMHFVLNKYKDLPITLCVSHFTSYYALQIKICRWFQIYFHLSSGRILRLCIPITKINIFALLVLPQYNVPLA